VIQRNYYDATHAMEGVMGGRITSVKVASSKRTASAPEVTSTMRGMRQSNTVRAYDMSPTCSLREVKGMWQGRRQVVNEQSRLRERRSCLNAHSIPQPHPAIPTDCT